MAKSPPAQPNEEVTAKNPNVERQTTAIADFVMKTLGQPKDFRRVAVVQLWANRFRVNVQTGADASSVRVAHSFFLTTDDNGQVIESVPPITRLY